MAEILPIVLVLLAIAAGSTLIAEKMVMPEPVVMAAIGIGLSFIPNFPTLQLNPRVVLLGFLPPLVYIAAAQLPWDEFRLNIRPILSLAVGLVAATSLAVATVSHFLVPGLGWAEAFALGAIVSPTDPVASTAISERLGVPRRLTAITEGEGLVNDAIALTLLHVATTAIATSTFVPAHVLLRLLIIVFGETAYGLLVGWVAAKLRGRISDARVEVTVSILTPFVAYLLPESLGGSGVLATVAAGMYIGIKNPELVPSATRLNLAGFWDIITYLLNGTLFLLTGLQFQSIVTGASHVLGIRVLSYGFIVTAVVIVLRFAWSWPAAWIDHHLPIPTSYSRLPNRHLTFLAWCGMRGGISLAAALSLAQTVPSRQTILLVTACVIAGTLIFQGAPLPFLLRKLKLDKDASREIQESMHQERTARLTAVKAALEKLRKAGSKAKSLRGEYQHRLHLLQHGEDPDSGIGPTGYRQEQVRLHLEAVAAEREAILSLYREGKLPEHVLHRIERDLDLTEVRLGQFLSRSD